MDPTPSDWREARRFRAFELKQDGWKQTDIAEALGVSEGAVSQWMKKAREGGKEALKTEPRPGRPPKLSEEERTERLPSLLEKGPEHFGFRGEVWTRKRVRKVIKEKFKVEYDVSQVGRILGSDRVEPPKTRPPVRQARRKGDRGVERGGVATNQKKPRLTIEP